MVSGRGILEVLDEAHRRSMSSRCRCEPSKVVSSSVSDPYPANRATSDVPTRNIYDR